MIRPATHAQEAYKGIDEIERLLRGSATERASFAEQHGGENMDFASIVIPDVTSLAQTDQPVAVASNARMRATLLAALKRDAQHRYATRGDLMRHALQREILSSYELGRVLELTE